MLESLASLTAVIEAQVECELISGVGYEREETDNRVHEQGREQKHTGDVLSRQDEVVVCLSLCLDEVRVFGGADDFIGRQVAKWAGANSETSSTRRINKLYKFS